MLTIWSRNCHKDPKMVLAKSVKYSMDSVAKSSDEKKPREANNKRGPSESGGGAGGGRRILKRIQLLFVAADVVASLFFVSILLSSYWEFANEVRLKIKSHAKRSSKETEQQRPGAESETRGPGDAWNNEILRKCIPF